MIFDYRIDYELHFLTLFINILMLSEISMKFLQYT